VFLQGVYEHLPLAYPANGLLLHDYEGELLLLSIRLALLLLGYSLLDLEHCVTIQTLGLLPFEPAVEELVDLHLASRALCPAESQILLASEPH